MAENLFASYGNKYVYKSPPVYPVPIHLFFNLRLGSEVVHFFQEMLLKSDIRSSFYLRRGTRTSLRNF